MRTRTQLMRTHTVDEDMPLPGKETKSKQSTEGVYTVHELTCV